MGGLGYYNDFLDEEIENIILDKDDLLIKKDDYKESWKPLCNSKVPKQKYFVKIEPYIRNKLVA